MVVPPSPGHWAATRTRDGGEVHTHTHTQEDSKRDSLHSIHTQKSSKKGAATKCCATCIEANIERPSLKLDTQHD